MVSIAAFQAVDPGSIPGRRNAFFRKPKKKNLFLTVRQKKNRKIERTLIYRRGNDVLLERTRNG